MNNPLDVSPSKGNSREPHQVKKNFLLGRKIGMKINRTHLHMNGLTLRLVLKQLANDILADWSIRYTLYSFILISIFKFRIITFWWSQLFLSTDLQELSFTVQLDINSGIFSCKFKFSACWKSEKNQYFRQTGYFRPQLVVYLVLWRPVTVSFLFW